MAYSFCWRYKCLPDGFSRSAFTATMTNLSRWNIPNMPGGVLYNTVIQSTPGVKVNVTGYAKDPTHANLVIDNLAGAPNPPNNRDWVIGTSRLPQSGLRSFDFVYTVSVPTFQTSHYTYDTLLVPGRMADYSCRHP
jgi:hypothetical protein